MRLLPPKRDFYSIELGAFNTRKLGCCSEHSACSARRRARIATSNASFAPTDSSESDLNKNRHHDCFGTAYDYCDRDVCAKGATNTEECDSRVVPTCMNAPIVSDTQVALEYFVATVGNIQLILLA